MINILFSHLYTLGWQTLNLHQRLGKPIPSSDPTIVTAEAGGKTSETKANKADVVSKKVQCCTAHKIIYYTQYLINIHTKYETICLRVVIKNTQKGEQKGFS